MTDSLVESLLTMVLVPYFIYFVYAVVMRLLTLSLDDKDIK